MENKYLVTYAYFNKYGYEGQEFNRIIVTLSCEMTENSIKEIEDHLTSKEDERHGGYNRYCIRVLSFVKLGENNSGIDKMIKYDES